MRRGRRERDASGRVTQGGIGVAARLGHVQPTCPHHRRGPRRSFDWCYARINGFRTTLVEHNLALGGVCTAWPRGPYLIDGCIQWLTGGPFTRAYQELGIIPAVPLRVLHHWVTYHDERTGTEVAITADLQALGRDLTRISPEDKAEVGRLLDAAARFTELPIAVARPPELNTVREQLIGLWQMRDAARRFGPLPKIHQRLDAARPVQQPPPAAVPEPRSGAGAGARPV